MNIFFIPSWYPSPSDSLPGIFFREQALALAANYPKINIGISTWGQNDQRLLLWSRQPLKSLSKIYLRKNLKPVVNKLKFDNLKEYFNPTLTWTEKVLNGNLKHIIGSNIQNLRHFEHDFGKADLIHAHVGYPAGFIANKISEMYNIPYVITEQMSPFPHSYYKTRAGKLKKGLIEAYRNSSKNIAISKNQAAAMQSFDINNINIIPNLVDETFFKQTVIKKQKDNFSFFSLGRTVPQKGIDILLKAFSQVKTDSILKIGGDGSSLNDYKQLAIELGIEKSVKWLGELDKITALKEFQHCDAFVLPSRHESMGIVFVEAMACGKPVIGTICGGPEEFINDQNGYLVPKEDAAELKSAMENMIKNHQKFDSDVIRSQFEKRFASKVVCRQIVEVYENII